MISLKAVMSHREALQSSKKTENKTINNLSIDSFFTNDKTFSLKKPISFNVVFKNDTYTMSNEQLDIIVTSDSMTEAKLDIQDQLGLLWKGYVECDEEELTKDAIEFRKFLIKYLRI